MLGASIGKQGRRATFLPARQSFDDRRDDDNLYERRSSDIGVWSPLPAVDNGSSLRTYNKDVLSQNEKVMGGDDVSVLSKYFSIASSIRQVVRQRVSKKRNNARHVNGPWSLFDFLSANGNCCIKKKNLNTLHHRHRMYIGGIISKTKIITTVSILTIVQFFLTYALFSHGPVHPHHLPYELSTRSHGTRGGGKHNSGVPAPHVPNFNGKKDSSSHAAPKYKFSTVAAAGVAGASTKGNPSKAGGVSIAGDTVEQTLTMASSDTVEFRISFRKARK